MSQVETKVDHSLIRANQAVIVLLLLAAFVANAPWLATIVMLVMLGGTLLFQRPGFWPLYTRILRPLGWVKPDVIPDNPEPHLFAQGMGGAVLLLAVIGLFLGAQVLGWGLVWLVIALAALNLFVGFCAGCMVYYMLNRLGIPGFEAHPLPETFPGMRPRHDTTGRA
jgi:hypothetical protein